MGRTRAATRFLALVRVDRAHTRGNPGKQRRSGNQDYGGAARKDYGGSQPGPERSCGQMFRAAVDLADVLQKKRAVVSRAPPPAQLVWRACGRGCAPGEGRVWRHAEPGPADFKGGEVRSQ